MALPKLISSVFRGRKMGEQTKEEREKLEERLDLALADINREIERITNARTAG